MKIKQSEKNKPQKIKINFTRILKDTSIFKDPRKIQLAFRKGTISTKNYNMQRIIKKFNLNKHSNYSSIELKPKKRDIPLELFNILEKSEEKFDKLNKSFISFKQQNEQFISHWNYTKKILKKLEIKKLIKEELEKNDEMDYYKKISKKFNFSERDKIEMDLEKKITQKIFKSNPLMLKNNNDIYFYLLNEAQQSPNKTVNDSELKSSKYLNKVKDFLEYIEIKSDKSLDEYTQRLRLKASNFMRNQRKETEEEKNNIDKEPISETKKMINDTNKLIKKLDKNKNYLEDPNYFTYYTKNNIKCMTPNKKLGNKAMIKSAKTDVFTSKKNNCISKDKYDKVDILKLKKNKLYKQLHSLSHESNNKKIKRIKKLKMNNLKSKYDKYYEELYSKDNNSTTNINLFNSEISNSQINNSTKSIMFKKSKSKALPSIKKYFPFYGFTNSSKSNNIIFQPVTIEENKIKESDLIEHSNKENMINKNNIRNEINISNTNTITEIENNINNRNINQEINHINKTETTNINNISNIIEKEEKKNNNEEIDININSINSSNNNENEKEEKKTNKIKILDLYDKIKGLKKLSNKKLDLINTYIKEQNIEYKKKKNIINLIKDAKILVDDVDINQIARDYFSYKCKENNKIKKFKKISTLLKNLDVKYLKELYRFKSTYGKNDYKINF